jgi:hypothetical protein
MVLAAGNSLMAEEPVRCRSRRRGNINTKSLISIFVFFLFFLASALSVSAQSNMNCSIYPRLSVPADMAPLINLYQGNDSHVEYGNESNYDFTVACKSNITNIGPNCSGNYVNVAQLYNYTDSHISVDNYYSRQVCFNASNTSLSWSSLITAIGAPHDDYECAFAIFNYSNSHVYDCDNVNASYNVNLRIAAGDVTPPTGSIVIYGINGTEFTGSRNVILNLTFADDMNVSACRWANDNAADLLSAPWENCTTVKAWILSEAEGNKTVYYEINDTSGNTAIFNDSIMYYFAQEYTPPSAPVVYDGLETDDIDWWNSNTTLSAHWFNSSEDISTIYYRYRILENGSCYNNDCNFTSVGEETQVTVENLALLEGSLYSFEVEAYNAGNLSASTISDGVRIDLTPPDAPDISSSTHPDQNRAYSSAYADFNWTAEDILSNGNMSGVTAYSYILDSSPGTAPDDIEEERDWETLAYLNNDGFSQPLKINGSGGTDYAYAVFSQLHTNMTVNDSIKVRVALAELVSDYRDLMNVKVYLARVAGTGDVSSFNLESSAISNINSVSWDIKYAYGMTLATIYEFTLTVNTTVNDGTDDIYIVVSGLSSDDNNRNTLAIAGATSGIDASTKNFVCSEVPACLQNTTNLDYSIEVKRADAGEWQTRYEALGDGTYYFHVKAKDAAGNWGDTAHYRINVAAGGVSVIIASPADGEIVTSETTSANISVRAVVSGNASVYIVAEHPDSSTYTSPSFVFSTTHTFENITIQQGRNELRAIANTSAGAVTTSSIVYVTLAPSIYQTTNKTLRVSYGACSDATPHLCYSTEGTNLVGVATESSSATAAGHAQADTSSNSIKIFMSKPFDLSKTSNDLEDNDFLDRTSPAFGYSDGMKKFVMGSELRYPDIYLDGDLNLQPGTYNLYIIHNGVTPDGRVNLTVEVR